MTEKSKELRQCPKCGQEYDRYPALSRKDNKTLICPDCGAREALQSIGISLDGQEKIIEAIHRSELPRPSIYERAD